MVEHLRHVHDGPRPLAGPQRQVVILRALVAEAKSAACAHEIAAQAGDVAGIHDAHQGIGRPVRLEERAREQPLRVDLVLVAVEEIGPGPVDRQGELVEAIGRQFVVVVEEDDVLPLGPRQRRVGGRRDAPVLRVAADDDPRIGDRREGRAGLRLRAGIVDEDQLPVRVPLGRHRGDGRLEVAPLHVVDRRQDREARPAPQGREARVEILRPARGQVAIAPRPGLEAVARRRAGLGPVGQAGAGPAPAQEGRQEGAPEGRRPGGRRPGQG
ncbi:hypothetical protein AEGHOMDF_4902 [Methylobacterium soli]|nr:hypothetical protein AEGHOMDF_4902 [Methylobacterium soli]